MSADGRITANGLIGAGHIGQALVRADRKVSTVNRRNLVQLL